MDSMQMQMTRAIFVRPKGATSNVMQQAFEQLCKQNISTIEWIKESEVVTTVVTQNLGISDFVIFDEFKGECFEELKEMQCTRILGPWCLIACLAKGIRIPNTTRPIYNAAMIGCIISCSLSIKHKKDAIKEKVRLMGGNYVESLTERHTHLVSGSVKSEKYEQAAEAGLKIMLPDWIDDVWEQSSQDVKIHCNDQQFEKYKCPPFHQLTISLTGPRTGVKDEQQRQQIKDLVTNNGGTFSAEMNLKKTDILIVIGDAGTTSQKFKAARKTENIKCVTWDWIFGSIEKGYALSPDKYHVDTVTSTPTKGDAVDSNFSVMSAIAGTSMMGTVEEETFLISEIAPEHEKENVESPICRTTEIIDLTTPSPSRTNEDEATIVIVDETSRNEDGETIRIETNRNDDEETIRTETNRNDDEETIRIETNRNDDEETIRIENNSNTVTGKGNNKNETTTVLQPEITSQKTRRMTFNLDYTRMAETSSSATAIFMISGVSNDYRLQLIEKIKALHGVVSDLSYYDPNCTHLICSELITRNEKILSCMAAGKWILHTNYVEKSAETGHFLNEKEFEFGNPKSVNNIPPEKRNAPYLWRKEIRRRGYGAFNDFRAIILGNNRDAFSRIVKAGGGSVIDVNPPFDGPVHATHCILEARTADFSPLTQKGIPCVSTIYIRDFLFKIVNDIRDYYIHF